MSAPETAGQSYLQLGARYPVALPVHTVQAIVEAPAQGGLLFDEEREPGAHVVALVCGQRSFNVPGRPQVVSDAQARPLPAFLAGLAASGVVGLLPSGEGFALLLDPARLPAVSDR